MKVKEVCGVFFNMVNNETVPYSAIHLTSSNPQMMAESEQHSQHTAVSQSNTHNTALPQSNTHNTQPCLKATHNTQPCLRATFTTHSSVSEQHSQHTALSQSNTHNTQPCLRATFTTHSSVSEQHSQHTALSQSNIHNTQQCLRATLTTQPCLRATLTTHTWELTPCFLAAFNIHLGNNTNVSQASHSTQPGNLLNTGQTFLHGNATQLTIQHITRHNTQHNTTQLTIQHITRHNTTQHNTTQLTTQAAWLVHVAAVVTSEQFAVRQHLLVFVLKTKLPDESPFPAPPVLGNGPQDAIFCSRGMVSGVVLGGGGVGCCSHQGQWGRTCSGGGQLSSFSMHTLHTPLGHRDQTRVSTADDRRRSSQRRRPTSRAITANLTHLKNKCKLQELLWGIKIVKTLAINLLTSKDSS
ncbi:hypothetical protein E2C01_008495 [Portunus trituberculatus]|uniref:Uncharacterized protein n=1 Tax=Portunus trituberculatus TaxID=210409 RepID=A0A5B7D304_PORTR|nr:hypothetical protein [Portunus trituberculatus]